MSKFIISLDFELHWGVFDVCKDNYNDNVLGAAEVIKDMLKLFDRHNMHVTWAIVGLLFNENKQSYDKYKPTIEPSYIDKNLCSLDLIIGEDEKTDKLHYAYNLIKLIKSYKNQEIASHSYSHYYCDAYGQNIQEFEADIVSAVNIAKDKFDINLKSFVFPRNELNHNYLSILKKYGLTSFRGNPQCWVYKKYDTNLIGRAIRFADTYINILGHNSSNKERKDGMTNIVGDRFLRPYKNKFLNILMLNRIKNEMKFAAKNNHNYHIWWHPHNFGVNTEQNLNNLNTILKEFKILKYSFGMESICMKDL